MKLWLYEEEFWIALADDPREADYECEVSSREYREINQAFADWKCLQDRLYELTQKGKTVGALAGREEREAARGRASGQ